MTKEQTNNWEEYIGNLKKVIFYSKGEYCPGCGITPEALEQLISQEKEKWEEELLANIKNMREVAIISDGTPLREGLVSKETLLNLLQK